MQQSKRRLLLFYAKEVSFFMASVELVKTINSYENFIKNHGISEELINAYTLAASCAFQEEKDADYGLKISARAKDLIESLVSKQTGGDIWRLERYAQDNKTEYNLINKYYELLKAESYDRFESFAYYMERKRPFKKRFYQPRKKTLKVVVDDLQDLEDSKISFYGLSMPSRVGKSTICIFFLSWVAMRKPDSHSAMGGHSGHLAKRFYRGLINLFTTTEYTFSELFEYCHPGLTVLQEKSADEYTINLGNPDEFSTITCRGIDGTWTGAIDVSDDGYLYVDDLVRDRQHSLSTMRMNETYQEYLNKMVDRKNDGAKELMVGTLWNVLDPLERIRNEYQGNPDYRFRRIPALNEHEESNFAYEVKGFSTKYYIDMKERLDNAEWMAKFMQQPYVREGLLFPADELRYFDGVVPEGKYRCVAVCDTALGGGDSLSMPICLDHENGKKYIIDWVHNKGTKKITVPLMVKKIIKHNVTELRIEKDKDDGISDALKEELKKQGYFHCEIITKNAPNKMSKEDKILGACDYIRDEFIFIMASRKGDVLPDNAYKRCGEYKDAMFELSFYTKEMKKGDHDDAADALAQLVLFFEDKHKARTANIIDSPV